MKDAPAFDFYAERWTHGTRHMSKVERCDYLDLLLYQWTEQGVPGEPDAIAKIIGYRKGSQVPATVLAKFPLCDDGKRRNARLEVMRSDQRARIGKKSEQRRAAALKRWHPDDATAMRPHGSRTVPAYAKPHAGECPPPTTHHPPNVLLEKEPKAREGSASDVRARQDSEAANATAYPPNLERMADFEDFRQAWGDWCCYRTERAVTGLKSQRVPWTARAAANTLSEVMRVAMSAGLAPITARCREAMASSWKGLNLGTMPMNGAVTGRTTTTRPRNLPDQIAGYTPDPKWSNP